MINVSDPFAAKIVLSSGVAHVLAGAELALSSMWLNVGDLDKIRKNTANNKNNLLIQQLALPKFYEKWLAGFIAMGEHLPPWSGQIKGFLPFGLIR